jgi:hypothetical protein
MQEKENYENEIKLKEEFLLDFDKLIEDIGDPSSKQLLLKYCKLALDKNKNDPKAEKKFLRVFANLKASPNIEPCHSFLKNADFSGADFSNADLLNVKGYSRIHLMNEKINSIRLLKKAKEEDLLNETEYEEKRKRIVDSL